MNKRPGWQTCNHEGQFDEHLCWVVTDQDLALEQTEEKFCPAKVDGVIRRFEHPLMGFMEPRQHDRMVTKYCLGCKKPFLLLVDENMCSDCKEKEQARQDLLRLESLHL